MTYKNNDYYEKTFGRHARCTSSTKGESFIPLYNEHINKEFKVMEWPTYAETFGKLHGASSRNRT
ncbi:MAG: hypothetical protein EBU90_17770 [Proteobacteria bacterium]|nr:hypothetical protein [Pseudomonadota bacterium]